MLALRLARGARPVVLLRRLTVAAASAGVGFLLLSALGRATGHPGAAAGSGPRLLWCLVPLAAAVYFAVAVARTDPSTRPGSPMTAAGLGPAGLSALSAVSTALSCLLGSVVALLFFLVLRGDVTGLPFTGAAARLLGAGSALPVAAALTLLAVTPVAAAVGSAWTLRPRRPARARSGQDGPERAGADPEAAPTGLPWGVALVAAGLAVEVYTSRRPAGAPLPVPGRFDGSPAGMLAGWTLTALGLALAGPALTHLCGRILQSVRPGAVRLLAGRVLQYEAGRIGRPLGALCAVVSGVVAAASVHGEGPPLFGPLTALGATLVVACTTATLLTSAVEARQDRAETTAALVRGCVPAGVLRSAAALRAAALFVVFATVTWAVAALAAAPLSA
ncbi:hypothetical protein OG204_27730 [Streptomyces sp. NBC_01387]|uniref:hypothetical protein n=1 Tax=unclassified Streptomyces TaxID=2593676 RepID=UPI002DD9EE2A|nr:MULTISPECIES: hypothetical protein [unclassified Streptomyces]WSC19548.1 hypothetical protein OIE60_07505 [Streptomyces sp. NBC_01766]WSV53569.1 hypothetical protein OG282_07475 [Streptomyces sp. NBC_01014]